MATLIRYINQSLEEPLSFLSTRWALSEVVAVCVSQGFISFEEIITGFSLKVSPLHSWQWPAMNFRVFPRSGNLWSHSYIEKYWRSSSYHRCENLITNITPFEATHEWHAVRLQLKPYLCLFLSSRLRHAGGCPVGTLDTYWWFSYCISLSSLLLGL